MRTLASNQTLRRLALLPPACALLGLACSGNPGAGSPGPPSVAGFTGRWVLDADASDQPPQLDGSRAAEPRARVGAGAAARRARTGAAVNREAIGTVLVIAGRRPELLVLTVTDSTYSVALPGSIFTLPIGGDSEEVYRGDNQIRVLARAYWRGAALNLERSVRDGGSITDRYELDDDGALVVTRRVSLSVGSNTETYRFVFRRRNGSRPPRNATLPLRRGSAGPN